MPSRPWTRWSPLLRADATGGAVLLIASLAALVWANSPVGASYHAFWGHPLTLGAGPVVRTQDLAHWVDDGLMVLFFFVVGLEIKSELVTGELRDRRTALLPTVAAAAGVALPALIFVACTAGRGGVEGWGVPMATDIAFAVGVIALLGARVPAGAKLLLLTIAVVDDVIAIAVIAIVYTDAVSPGWLAGAVGGLVLVVVLRRAGVVAIWPYVPVGVAVWVCTLESGVHATVAGVALALLTPAGATRGRDVLSILTHRLSPLSSLVVVPVFALANAGVDVDGGAVAAAAASPIALGVAVGLVVGKLLGVSGGALVMARTGWGRLPAGVATRHVIGVAALAGIGFTVSLFVADLAYADTASTDVATIGIFAGSLVAGLLGLTILGARRPGAGTATTTTARAGTDPDQAPPRRTSRRRHRS